MPTTTTSSKELRSRVDQARARLVRVIDSRVADIASNGGPTYSQLVELLDAYEGAVGQYVADGRSLARDLGE